MERRRSPVGAWILSVLTLLSIAPLAQAAEQRIGLVLGGGGARGAAHIGVLKVLERERIPIHAIAGTSMGAIVGGLYAAGYSPDEMEQVIGSVDWRDVFHDSSARADWPMRQKELDIGNVTNLEVGRVDGHFTLPNSLIKGQRLGLLLRQLFLGRSHLESFNDLPIPFRCVATDVGTIKPVVFDSGDLATAIRASMSLPATFAPVHHDGKVLVDGGVVDNLPVLVARQMGVDRLIVVDVGSSLAPGQEVDSPIAILHQMIGGMMREHSEATMKLLAEQDIYVRPDIPITTLDFPHIDKAIGPGEQAAMQALDRLRALSVPQQQYASWQVSQRRRFQPEPEISSVTVDGTRSRTAAAVRDRITAQAGRPLDRQSLERDINNTFGRADYDTISYHLSEDADGATSLVVTPVDSSLGKTVLRLGLQINDDFSGTSDYQLNGEVRVRGLTSKGGEWRSLLAAGRVTGLATELYLPFGARGDWFTKPQVGYTATNQPLVVDNTRFAEYRVETWHGALHFGRDFYNRVRASAGLFRSEDRADRKIADPVLPATLSEDYGGITGSLLWDTLDGVKFPKRGLRAETLYHRFDTYLGSDSSGDLWHLSIDKPMTSGANTLMLGARAVLSPQDVGSFDTQAALGGLTYLSGLGERELIGSQMLFFRGIYYRRLTREAQLINLSVPVYVAASLEAGNVWSDHSDVSMEDLMGAGSLFMGIDLPIGPLQLGYGRTSRGRDAFYLSFGSLVLPRYR